MAEFERENLVERTLANLAAAWRDIAQGAARSVGLKVSRVPREGDATVLKTMMQECLEARGGEVSARIRAATLGKAYLEMAPEGKQLFFKLLAAEFAVDRGSVERAITAYRKAEDTPALLAAEQRLRQALEPPRSRLFTQFNALPEGVKFLVDLRADLLALGSNDHHMAAMDADLRMLLASWFDVGFLDLQAITWQSPAALLEKLIAYEAVHQIRSWEDLRNRLDSDRRCFAMFHPRMPDEPLAFVEVALVKGMAGNIQVLLDEDSPAIDPAEADAAIFYSISNTQKGLQGISFGEYLIKLVVNELTREFPRLKTFATLSPIPLFRNWLSGLDESALKELLTEQELAALRRKGGSGHIADKLADLLDRPEWPDDESLCESLKGPLTALCTRYLLEHRDDGQPYDPVARFHLRNGARLERLNWLADVSENGLGQSAGMMVSYRYVLDEIEKNHEAFVLGRGPAMGSEFRALVRALPENGSSPLRRLRMG